MKNLFSNTKSVIIGGTSGIGLATADQLIASGGDVVIASHSKDKVQAALRKLGKGATGKFVDITDFDSLASFFSEIAAFDHLLITATQTLFKPFAELTSEEILNMVNTKLLGSLFTAQAAVKHIKPHGSINFFGGFIGHKAWKNGSVVALINSGLEGLTRSLALELGPIRVNLIAPGLADTGRWDQLTPENKLKAKASAGASFPVQRVGETDDFVDAILMMLKNTFMTGSVVRIDGGAHL